MIEPNMIDGFISVVNHKGVDLCERMPVKIIIHGIKPGGDHMVDIASAVTLGPMTGDNAASLSIFLRKDDQLPIGHVPNFSSLSLFKDTTLTVEPRQDVLDKINGKEQDGAQFQPETNQDVMTWGFPLGVCIGAFLGVIFSYIFG